MNPIVTSWNPPNVRSWPAAIVTELVFAAAVISVQVFTSPTAARVWSPSSSSASPALLSVAHLCEHQSLATGLATFAAMTAVSIQIVRLYIIVFCLCCFSVCILISYIRQKSHIYINYRTLITIYNRFNELPLLSAANRLVA